MTWWRTPGGRTFLVVWFGQFVSRIGTAMTRFALLIWAYDQTSSAMTVALLAFFGFVPFIIVSPFAGVWVDRMDRRRVMLLSDLASGVLTAVLFVLYAGGELALWHLYAFEALTSALDAFQGPAYSAASTLLLPKEDYARGSGLRSIAEEGARVIAPFLAGFLIVWIGVAGVMIVDVVTFLAALVTLLVTRFPRPPAVEGETPHFRDDVAFGFRYIWRRPGLRGLTAIYAGINFFAALTYLSILPAMILARSGKDELALATVQGALGAAGVVGGLLLAVWGGPKRKIHGVLGAAALSFLFGDFLFAVGRGVGAWVVAAVVSAVFIPIIIGSRMAIWQAKVEPALQGRVFSADVMLRLSLMPAGYLLAGVLADRLLEPAMAEGGSLAGTFGPLVGTGPGTGMALMFVGTATLGALMSLSGYLFRSVRDVEIDLPDHDYRPTRTVADSDLA